MNLLFTTKTCPNCPAAEKVLQENGIEYEKLYAEEMPTLAQHYRILSVPTLVVDTKPWSEPLDLYVGLSNIIGFAEGGAHSGGLQ